MDDARIEELMWLEIDETISSADRETLNTYLRGNPAASERLAALRRMTLLFGQVGEVDPPQELRERILRALETATPPRSHRAGLFARSGTGEKKAGVLDRFAALFAPRPAWGLAGTAAAGVLIGVVGYHLIRSGLDNGGSADNSRFYGSMNNETVDANGAVLHIDVEGVTGEFRVRRDGSHVFTELDVRSERAIEVTLDYDGPPVDIAADEPSRLPGNEMAVLEKGVRVRQRGSGTYRFSFALAKDAASPVTVSVRSEPGKLLYQTKVLPPLRAGAGERQPEESPEE